MFWQLSPFRLCSNTDTSWRMCLCVRVLVCTSVGVHSMEWYITVLQCALHTSLSQTHDRNSTKLHWQNILFAYSLLDSFIALELFSCCIWIYRFVDVVVPYIVLVSLVSVKSWVITGNLQIPFALHNSVKAKSIRTQRNETTIKTHASNVLLIRWTFHAYTVFFLCRICM